jgi:hypothetical protein
MDLNDSFAAAKTEYATFSVQPGESSDKRELQLCGAKPACEDVCH